MTAPSWFRDLPSCRDVGTQQEINARIHAHNLDRQREHRIKLARRSIRTATAARSAGSSSAAAYWLNDAADLRRSVLDAGLIFPLEPNYCVEGGVVSLRDVLCPRSPASVSPEQTPTPAADSAHRGDQCTVGETP